MAGLKFCLDLAQGKRRRWRGIGSLMMLWTSCRTPPDCSVL